MARKKRSVNVSFTCPVELLDKLDDLSRQTGRSVSSLVREAVQKFLEVK